MGPLDRKHYRYHFYNRAQDKRPNNPDGIPGGAAAGQAGQQDLQKERLETAFNQWGRYAHIEFELTDDAGSADILVGFEGRTHSEHIYIPSCDEHGHIRNYHEGFETGDAAHALPPRGLGPQWIHYYGDALWIDYTLWDAIRDGALTCWTLSGGLHLGCMLLAFTALGMIGDGEDFWRTSLHEIGHVMGLAHKPDGPLRSRSVMYQPEQDGEPKWKSFGEYRLSQQDRRGVASLYPTRVAYGCQGGYSIYMVSHGGFEFESDGGSNSFEIDLARRVEFVAWAVPSAEVITGSGRYGEHCGTALDIFRVDGEYFDERFPGLFPQGPRRVSSDADGFLGPELAPGNLFQGCLLRTGERIQFRLSGFCKEGSFVAVAACCVLVLDGDCPDHRTDVDNAPPAPENPGGGRPHDPPWFDGDLATVGPFGRGQPPDFGRHCRLALTGTEAGLRFGLDLDEDSGQTQLRWSSMPDPGEMA